MKLLNVKSFLLLLLCTVVPLISGTAHAESWTQLATAGSPPAFRCYGASTVYDSASNRMILFGGRNCSGGSYNDVWILTNANGVGGTPQWMQLTTSGTPGARNNHSAVYDSANNRMIIFGGCMGACTPTLNDVWVLSNANGLGGTPTWTSLSASGAPAARQGHRAAYDPATNRMMVYAGQNGSGFLGSNLYLETWVLSNANGMGGSPAWTKLVPSGSIPPGAYYSSMVYDSSSNRMTVFGGADQSAVARNAVWALSNANGQGGAPVWSNLIPEGASGSPSPRSVSATGHDATQNRMTIFGGGSPGNDTWMLSNASGIGSPASWTQIATSGAVPGSAQAATLDSASNRMTVFSNCIPAGCTTNEVWVLPPAAVVVPVPTLSSITVTPANPTINVSQTQQFTATANYSDGSSQVLTAISGSSPVLVSSTFFGGSGNQAGTGIAVSGASVLWSSSDARYGSHNSALTTQNFNQFLGGSFSELNGIAVQSGSIFAAGSSRPAGLTVDNVGGWENKPVAFKAPAATGTPRDWLTQISGTGYTDRVFSYSGTEITNGIALADVAAGGAMYSTGVGENWGGTGQYALWLAKLNSSGVKQWTVSYGQSGTFTSGTDLAVLGSDIYVAGQAGSSAMIRKYQDAGSTATQIFGNTYGAGTFNDITALDGLLYAAGNAGADARIVKINSAGTQLWSQTYDLGTANDVLYGMVAHNGRLFAVGRDASDAILFEINPATGAMVGSPTRYHGVNNMEDVFNDVSVDASNGRLYAIGYTTTSSTGQDVLIVAYDTTGSGSVVWASSNEGVATINGSGLASGSNAGTSTITATLGSVSGNTTLLVTSPNGPPAANAGMDQTVEASAASGAAVSLNGSASSDPDGDMLSYIWSGSFGAVGGMAPTLTLPLGTHPITLTVSDGTASASDNVVITVRDTTAPVIATPSNITAEASNAAGAIVSYSSPATSDAVGGAGVATCMPVSGSMFALVNTIVTCSAADSSGNSATSTFIVSVVDSSPPLISVPADITIEAANASGTTVDFTASASDQVDGTVATLCAPAAGSNFALGTTAVTCTASDTSGNSSSALFSVTVSDTSPPLIAAVVNISAEAANAAGAVVSYASPATSDMVDGAGVALCLPSSGSVFALGTTVVVCNAVDGSGNSAAPVTFAVQVSDTTPPVIAATADLTVEATSTAGATVTFSTPAATDAVSVAAVTCLPLSGSTFPLGTTIVTCSASDAAGNSSSTSFSVTVQDTTPPVLNVPASMTVDAASPAGATVSYLASATDSASTSVTVNCAPASGSNFPVGTTTVVCTALDVALNSTSASFTVTVRTPSQMIANLALLVDQIAETNAAQGIANSLDAKLQSAMASLDALKANSITTACNQLSAFINNVDAQSGKAITVEQANQLKAAANQIKSSLGCM